jgi:hypothetical protein
MRGAAASPAALLAPGEEPRQRRLRHHYEVDLLTGVFGGAVELIEKGHAGRAGAFLEWQERRLPARGPGALAPIGPREHEVVDHQRVLAGREQLRHPHVGGTSVRGLALEDVVLGDDAAGRQLAPGGGHRLHLATQLDFPLQQPVARRPVCRRLAGKRDAHTASIPSVSSGSSTTDRRVRRNSSRRARAIDPLA